MEAKYSKFLTVLLIAIIVAIVGLLGYLGFNYLRDSKIDKEAAEYVESFGDQSEQSQNVIITDQNVVVVPDINNQANEYVGNTDTNSSEENIIEVEDTNSTGGGSSGGSSSSKPKYKGFNTLGTIEIPKTDVKYPILESPTRKALEIAVAALWPRNPVLNTEGNVVIIGHNYRNGKFFSNNKKLSNGDKIIITDLNKKKVTYVIYKVFEAGENDTDFYNRDTKGAKEITLSTCTDDGSKRTIIFAKAQ